MSAHKCPKCRHHCFIWIGSEAENGRDCLLWSCGCCDYLAYEYDESQTRLCPNCQSPIFLQPLLTDEQHRYWWCSSCNHQDTIEVFDPSPLHPNGPA